MGVLGWLVASALCAAVRGESVPRDGAKAPGDLGSPRNCMNTHGSHLPIAGLMGTQGRVEKGFFVGCAKPCAWSPPGEEGCGVVQCLEGLARGEDENRAAPSQAALTHAPTPTSSLFLQRAVGGGGQVVAGSVGGDKGSRAPQFPSPGAWGTAHVPGALAPSLLPACRAPSGGTPIFGDPLILGCWGPSERC